MILGTDRIGPYQLGAALGSGAMGHVYRAVDTKFNRPVAIKFLSDAVADAAGRQRFQREAQTVSSLNHPHILTVHDVGEFEGRQYLVTELVDGGTLAEWARAENRTWRQIVDLLAGVADGLAAAHAAGILHRDIKPANILVAKNGYAKLGDFGLAKLVDSAVAAEDDAVTIADRTQQGIVLGTAAYMSPEQAAGKPLDARSDIFSLGVVLYEVLAGRRPFTGATDLEVIQAIRHRPPEPLPLRLPAGLRFVLEKALANDPAERYQATRELVVDLRRLARAPDEAVSSGATLPSPRRQAPSWLTGLAIVLIAAAALALVSRRAGWGPLATSPALDNLLTNARFTRVTNFEGTERSAAVSPDGRFLAFRADRAGPLDVWMSQLGTGRFVNLTQGNDDEFSTDPPSLGFSFDGSQIWLGGGAGRRLRVMPLMGDAPPRGLLPEDSVGVAWAPGGSRLAYHLQDEGDSIFVAESTGANARRIFRQSRNKHNHFLSWSMDGRWIYFTSGTPAIREMDIWRIAAEGGVAERLTQHSSEVASPTPLDPRTVLYVARDRDDSGPWLWAVDTERKVSQRVSFGVEKYTSVAATADGRRLVVTVANPISSLWAFPILADRLVEESDVRPFDVLTSDASAPRFGGASLFFLSSLGAGAGLWRFNEGQALEIWKGGDGSVMAPAAVSPDGRRLAVVLRRDGALRLHVLPADGTGLTSIAETLDVRGGASWSPDGKWIVAGGEDARGPGLFQVPSDTGGVPVRLADGAAVDPVWSPDGSLIVFAGANVSISAPLRAIRPDGASIELPEIHLRRNGERVQFTPDGKALIYMQGTRQAQDFWMLDLATKQTRPLTRLTRRDSMRTFAITQDGKQIVFDRLRENSDIVLIDLPR